MSKLPKKKVSTTEAWLQNATISGISTAVGLALGNLAPIKSVTILEAVMLVLIAFVIYGSIKLALEIREDMFELKGDIASIASEPAVTIDWYHDFKALSELVSTAERRILVATAIGTKSDNIARTPTRSTYMDRIAQKVRDNPRFAYTRVMPAHKLQDLMQGITTIDECDRAAADHLRAIAKILKEPDNVETGMRPLDTHIILSGPVALLPSTIVIDEKYVAFALPRMSVLEDGRERIVIDDVIIITDHRGKIPRRMGDMIMSVASSGHEITSQLSKFVPAEATVASSNGGGAA